MVDLCAVILLYLVTRCLVCFYACCGDFVGVCGNVCRVVGVVEDSVFNL